MRSVREYYHEYNHYAWLIVAIATILQVTTGFVSQAFAVLMVQLEEDLSWTLTAITLAYFLRSVDRRCPGACGRLDWGQVWRKAGHAGVGVFLYVIGMLLLSRIEQYMGVVPLLQLHLGGIPGPVYGQYTHHRSRLVQETAWEGQWVSSSPPEGWALR